MTTTYHLPLRKPTPEWRIGLFRAVGAIQLASLFLAGVGVYVIWWMVQAVIMVLRLTETTTGTVWKTWGAIYPTIKETAFCGAEIARDSLARAWDFRTALIAEGR